MFDKLSPCLSVQWQKMAHLVLRRVGLCVGQNQMCHLCGWLKLFLKNVRWGKNKKHRVGPDSFRDRLTRCPFVISFLCLWSPVKMVYFFCLCHSFVCRVVVLIHLLPSVCSLAKWRKSKHKCSVLHKSSIEEPPLNLALNPPFCQTAVLVAQLKYTNKLV